MRRRKTRPGQKRLADFEFTKGGKLPISKLDAARRQLETAVDLWFHEGDPVSIHTLTMAAHEILKVLNRAQNGPPMMGEPCPHIREEYTDLWREVCVRHAAFFKHSSHDADETHYFPPTINDVLILDATEVYLRIANDVRPLFRLFKWYMRLHLPEIFIEETPVNDPDLKAQAKPEFFDLLIGVASDPAPLAEQYERLRQILQWG